jgi:hypothetical protein
MPGYSVTFSVVDDATKHIEAINKRIQQLRAPLDAQARVMRKFVDVTGLKAVAEGFGKISDAATKAAHSVGALTPGMAALTGGGIIFGMTKLVTEFADWNRELEKTGLLLDETPERLSGVEQAARSIGASSKTAIEALKGLRQAQYEAMIGANPVAANSFARANIPLVDMNKNFRGILDVEGDVLKYLDKLPVGMDRLAEATRVGAPAVADLFNELKANGITVEAFLARERRMQTLTAENRKTFEDTKEAITKLNAAFYDLGLRSAAAIAPALTPAIVALSNNIDTVARVAEGVALIFAVSWGVKAVKGVYALVSALAAMNTALTTGILATVTRISASGFFAMLGRLSPLTAGAYTLLHSNPAGSEAETAAGAAGAVAMQGQQQQEYGAWAAKWRPRGGSPAPAASPSPAASPAPAAGGAAPAAFKAAIEGAESSSGYSNQPQPGHRATGPRQMLPETFDAFAKPGERIDNPDDNRRVSDRYIDYLWNKYGGDPKAVAYAYANGSPSSPDRNPGYVDKVLGAYGAGGGDQASAYGVPGAVMNYGGTGALGAPGTNLTRITDAQGNRATVNKAAAGDFQGFLADLEARGYPVNSLGGYAMRNKAGGSGLSEHAFGTAIDINPGANPMGGTKTDMPADIENIARSHGLVWGGLWKGSTYDPMHFQWGGPEASRLAALGRERALAGGSMPNGSVNVTVTHKNAPAGVSVDAASSGNGIKLAAPRVEHQEFGQP